MTPWAFSLGEGGQLAWPHPRRPGSEVQAAAVLGRTTRLRALRYASSSTPRGTTVLRREPLAIGVEPARRVLGQQEERSQPPVCQRKLVRWSAAGCAVAHDGAVDSEVLRGAGGACRQAPRAGRSRRRDAAELIEHAPQSAPGPVVARWDLRRRGSRGPVSHYWKSNVHRRSVLDDTA